MRYWQKPHLAEKLFEQRSRKYRRTYLNHLQELFGEQGAQHGKQHGKHGNKGTPRPQETAIQGRLPTGDGSGLVQEEQPPALQDSQ